MAESRAENVAEKVGAVGTAEAATVALIALAKEAAAGNVTATTKLLRVVAPRLAAMVRAILGSSHPDFDDAVQQTLIGFVQALPAFRGDCDPTGYGRIIAVRAAIAFRKRTRAEHATRDDEAEADAIVGAEPSPREQVAREKRKALLRELLAELPEQQAEALAMRVVLGCSLEEVASASGVPLNTVRSRVRLAKERLKARIEKDPAMLEMLEVTP